MSGMATQQASRHVAVLMGGFSAEREVSLVSGKACADALREAGYRVQEIDVQRDLRHLLDSLMPAHGEKPEVVFNALHGRFGEDGCVQGVLEIAGLPYTHSGVMASAIAMDKEMAKRVFESAGLRMPEGMIVHRSVFANGHPMKQPYVVKPIAEGSSVGVVIVREGANIAAPDMSGWAFGDQVMVERYIPGRELTVAVMGDKPLAVTELRPTRGFYDYDAKYTDGITDHVVPAQISEAVTSEAKRVALEAHRLLGCRGVSRCDFRYDDSRPGIEGLYLLELNTQPGMTPLSLVPEQAKHSGISFPELVSWMVEQALCPQ
ncbi:MAG: D-alanine--D-alanine ligase [Alphaproteobacteria bacterium]|jgi:D-alanine-D-alanine ligase|nr:D-alanine--D-alanine ligase [Alphaproteobacteria bacterium]